MKPMLPSDPELDAAARDSLCIAAEEAMLAGALSPENIAHVLNCPACRDFQALLPFLRDGIAGLPTPPRDSGQIDSILAASVADRRASVHRRQLRWGVGSAAVAASILVAVCGLVDFRTSPVLDATGVVAATAVPKFPEEAPPSPPPPLRDKIVEARETVVSALSRTADETVESTWSWLPGPMTLPAPDLLQPLEPAVASLEEVGQGAAVSVHPLTDSAKRAVGLFRKEFPSID